MRQWSKLKRRRRKLAGKVSVLHDYFLLNLHLSRSLLRHLGFSKGKLYVVDSGLNRVFIIMEDEEANVFGEEGDKLGALSNPTQVAFDAKGNVIIADLKNNRLQLVDENGNFYPVKVRTVMLTSIFPDFLYYFRPTVRC